MKMITIAALAMAFTTVAQARQLSCTDGKLKVTFKADEAAQTFEMSSGLTVKFEIYKTQSYEVEGGKVTVYELGKGLTQDGRHFSGDIGILGEGENVRVQMSLVNQDLAKHVWTNKEFSCKDVSK